MDTTNHTAGLGEDLSAFEVRNKREIEKILRGLSESRTLVSVENPRTQGGFLSTFLGVDTDKGAAYLECKDTSAADPELLAGGRAIAKAFTDGIEIRIPLPRLHRVHYDRLDAYQLDLPDMLYRIQRRQCFRMPVGQGRPAHCLVRLDSGEIEMAVLDISLTGVGLRLDSVESPFSPGQKLERAKLRIPDLGDHFINLIVRNTIPVTLKNGGKIYRVGCEFEELPRNMERVMQTYLFKLEAERRALAD